MTDKETKLTALIEAADHAFLLHDQAKAELRRLEAELTRMCRQYDQLTGSRGLRHDRLRYAVDLRKGRRAA